MVSNLVSLYSGLELAIVWLRKYQWSCKWGAEMQSEQNPQSPRPLPLARSGARLQFTNRRPIPQAYDSQENHLRGKPLHPDHSSTLCNPLIVTLLLLM
jgi:hypothetical protein